MSTLKVLAPITACSVCSNRRYASGGIYECSLTGIRLVQGKDIPSWCPLPDHPAAKMAGLENENLALRQTCSDRMGGNTFLSVYSLLCVQLGLSLDSNFCVRFKIDGVEAGIRPGLNLISISNEDFGSFKIVFSHNGVIYKFTIPNSLDRQIVLQEQKIPDGKTLWLECEFGLI